ncbi:hypothetical protein ACQEVB_33885 [Pseudonocardia sp. CA-107938]|uniref:hypothetical protein n=1 Tax=Pseudonocardia sp. CA-107938 TaxID=3240021 RepID=UPI003D8EF700
MSTASDATPNAARPLDPTGPTRAERRVAEQPTTVMPDRRTTVARQRLAFGGIRWGSAFFGWLTAMGTAVLLTAVAAAIGGLAGLTTPAALTGYGITAGIVVLAVLFVAYLAGGYVAGRMARFDGVKQGFAVWLWSLIVAAVVTLLGLATGLRFTDPSMANGLPALPTLPEAFTAAAVVAGLLALGAALLGALLGGLAGMRYHRRIDRAGFEET